MYIRRHELIRYLESRLPPLGSDKVETTPLPSYTMLYVLQCCHCVTPAYATWKCVHDFVIRLSLPEMSPLRPT